MSAPRSAIALFGLFCAGALPTIAAAQQVQYEKYQLPNGLTVILSEDHSLPVVAVNLWYRVGGKDEPVGRSGFAHLFEHLMFMGTERAPGSAFDDIMEAGGGSNNASTSDDRTNYFESGPARLLPTLLWLEADRLEDLGRTMTKEKLDKQRDVVRNERRQSYENQPYGKAQLSISGLMFPAGHPYHIPVIGTHEDLEAATVDDVKEFFANYYVPNNCSLCVAGDFDSAEIKPLIQKLFGTLPRGQNPIRSHADPVTLDRVLRVTKMDQVQLPLIMMVYHSPAFYQPGDAEMDLAAAVLTNGKTSRLYKRLVYQEQLAVEVSASQQSAELGSMFEIDILAIPGADLNRVEAIVDEELGRFLKEGPTADELARHKTRIETQMVSGLQSLLQRADQLNAYEYHFGEPNSFQADLDRYRKATPESVTEWARRVITPNARLIMRVLPEGSGAQQSPRDAKPAELAARPFTPQKPSEFKLKNGISVWLWQKSDLPLVSMMLLEKPGTALDPQTTAGLSSLMVNMLDEGAGDRDALAFGDAIQALGASLNASAGRESATVSLSVLKRNLEPATALMADAVLRPRFDESEWARVKSLHLDALKQEDDNPTAVASRVAARRLFGDANPYGRPLGGTTKSVTAIGVEQIRAQHGRVFRPDNAVILIAGDISMKEAESLLNQQFGGWSVGDASPLAACDFAVPPIVSRQTYVVDRPGAVQTVVRMVMPGVNYRDDRRTQLDMINTILGGTFTSRLNALLREEKGWTYGASSRYAMEPSIGQIVIGSNIQAPYTGVAVTAILDQLETISHGTITEAELKKARESVRTDVIESFAGLGGILGNGATLVTNGMPFEVIAQDLKTLEMTTLDELNKLSRIAFPIDRSVLILVGDKTLIDAQMAEQGLPLPIEIDVNGDPVGGK